MKKEVRQQIFKIADYLTNRIKETSRVSDVQTTDVYTVIQSAYLLINKYNKKYDTCIAIDNKGLCLVHPAKSQYSSLSIRFIAEVDHGLNDKQALSKATWIRLTDNGKSLKYKSAKAFQKTDGYKKLKRCIKRLAKKSAMTHYNNRIVSYKKGQNLGLTPIWRVERN